MGPPTSIYIVVQLHANLLLKEHNQVISLPNTRILASTCQQPSEHPDETKLSRHIHLMKRKKLLIRLDNESDVVVRLVCDKQKSTSR